MRREDFTVRDIVLTEKPSCQNWVLRGDAQTAPFVRLIIPREMPQISTGTHIDPWLRNSNDETTIAIAQIPHQDDQVLITIILILILLSIATMLGQNIIARHSKRSIATLHEQWHIGSTLKDHLQIRQAPDTCKILTRVATIHFHAAFSQKCQCCCL